MIAIVDYGAGNLTSVKLAFDALGADTRITASASVIRTAERVVFPGVGAAGSAMKNLRKLKLAGVLGEVVERGTPFLGICLGTQIILDRSEEDGGTDCLGLVRGTVKLFMPRSARTKVPHMGWNSVQFLRRHPVLKGIRTDSEFYFVHSYYPAPAVHGDVVGQTAYAGRRFAAIMGRANLVAVQFHPERSGRIGLKLLENFCKWTGGTC